MGQAATRVPLRELSREFREEGIRASEVTLSDPLRTDAGRCAEAIRGVLSVPDSEAAGFSIHKV